MPRRNALTLLAACCLIAGAPSASAAARARENAGGPFPDTLLARVGAHRTVSLSVFRRSWSLVAPPERPDSLTPESARKFLDLLIGKEVLGEAALSAPGAWSARDSAEYLELADRLVMTAVLDSALRAVWTVHAARGDTLRDMQTLGAATRDDTFKRLQVVFDTTLTRHLAAAWNAIPVPPRDSSLMVQLRVLGIMPAVAPADSGRILAKTADGDIRVSELVSSWSRLSPVQRPRVSKPSQIEDLTRNALFERLLRRDAARRGVEKHADIVAQLANKREFIDVTHLVSREVYEKLVADSLTLQHYYDRHIQDFRLPTRVRALRLDLPHRAEATKMALQIRDPVEAESLIARGRRRGVVYVSDLTSVVDSTLFDRALAAGTGTVLGPDSTAAGWTVMRIMAVLPAGPRPFHEAQALVHHAWYGEEGERRLVESIARLRRGTRVSVNQHALDRLVAEGVNASTPAAPRPK
jgi:hypothetical protein